MFNHLFRVKQEKLNLSYINFFISIVKTNSNNPLCLVYLNFCVWLTKIDMMVMVSFLTQAWRSCGLFWYMGIKVSFQIRQVNKTIQMCNRLDNTIEKKILKLFLNVMYFHLKVPYYNCKVINDIFSRMVKTYSSCILRMHDSSRLHITHEQNRRKNVMYIKEWK